MTTTATKHKYFVIIRREECFEIEAETAEEAVDIAFDNTWTYDPGPTSNEPCVLEHWSNTIDHVVEEIEVETKE